MKNILTILAIVVSTMMHSKIISAVELTGSVRNRKTKMEILKEKVDCINQLNDDDDFRDVFVNVRNRDESHDKHVIVRDILDCHQSIIHSWHDSAQETVRRYNGYLWWTQQHAYSSRDKSDFDLSYVKNQMEYTATVMKDLFHHWESAWNTLKRYDDVITRQRADHHAVIDHHFDTQLGFDLSIREIKNAVQHLTKCHQSVMDQCKLLRELTGRTGSNTHQ